MNINIEVVDVTVVNKGKYQIAEVTAKQDGKTNTKKVVSFGAQENAYKVIKDAKKGECFTVEIQKNADGYWDWITVSPAGSVDNSTNPAVPGKSAAAPARGNYETPEERAARQEYIIRQSSIANAIAYLNHTKKSYEPIEILDMAESFVMFVYKTGTFPTFNQVIDPDADVPV